MPQEGVVCNNMATLLTCLVLLVGLSSVCGLEKPHNAYWEGNCGYSMYPDAGRELPGQRIVGGWNARIHEFPYQGLVYYKDQFDCGASLIDKHYVLTAAHCIVPVQANAESFTVGFGEHNRSVPPPDHVVYNVSQVIPHEHWNNMTNENDIALLKLTDAVPFTNASFPVCSPLKTHNYTDRNASVSGWGLTDNNATSEAIILQYTNLPVMSASDCEKAWGNSLYPGMICAGYLGENKRDSCSGDSGGPLAVKNSQGRFEQLGIVSWGGTCAGPKPGVYTDVLYYLDWISSKITTD